jgi:CheY-like chemotaxis protein
LGLGLAIVRQLVEMHAGSVSATSEGAGQGTTFTVRLPTVSPLVSNRNVPKENSAATERIAQGVQLEGVRVLVVDDEKDSREMVERMLSRLGAHVLMADSTPNALSQLKDFDAHVVVSDIGMPGMDGYSLIREIRRRRSPSQLPAVALTAYARPEERQRALDAGFQIHVAKPVGHAELTAAISRLVHPADDVCPSIGQSPSALGRAGE